MTPTVTRMIRSPLGVAIAAVVFCTSCQQNQEDSPSVTDARSIAQASRVLDLVQKDNESSLIARINCRTAGKRLMAGDREHQPFIVFASVKTVRNENVVVLYAVNGENSGEAVRLYWCYKDQDYRLVHSLHKNDPSRFKYMFVALRIKFVEPKKVADGLCGKGKRDGVVESVTDWEHGEPLLLPRGVLLCATVTDSRGNESNAIPIYLDDKTEASAVTSSSQEAMDDDVSMDEFTEAVSEAVDDAVDKHVRAIGGSVVGTVRTTSQTSQPSTCETEPSQSDW